MNTELIIHKDENTIIVIRRENVQLVRHQPKYTYQGFSSCISLDPFKSYTPMFTEPESWYVIMKNGDKFDLTKKQYNIVKGWFK